MFILFKVMVTSKVLRIKNNLDFISVAQLINWSANSVNIF